MRFTRRGTVRSPHHALEAEGIDHVTNKLFDLIDEGDGQSIRFFLKARAGWIDRPLVEVNQGQGGPLTIVHLLRHLDPLPDGLSEGCRRAYGSLRRIIACCACSLRKTVNPLTP